MGGVSEIKRQLWCRWFHRWHREQPGLQGRWRRWCRACDDWEHFDSPGSERVARL